ncbi:hypothetical protein B0J13DRAFT_570033 [Dactylonectria estremocensis]|uniref:Uncharacterized protein n=1 Tax=Dactylonectria estremocensis TaxID=1079267 RepID=A0A9P9DFI5_9HYPO|nr:hypothetical protein B0J13DRAFT_570033 [Dactylonectria estremocensis]
MTGLWRLEIGKMEKGDGLDVLWFQDLDHGEVFSGRRTRKRLVNIVRRFVGEG